MTTFTNQSAATAVQIRNALHCSKLLIWSWIIESGTRRAQFAILRQLKERDLRDVGLIENDICAASHLPLGSDAAAVLHSASIGRTGNW